ncbi:tyrosine-type recombinase/integrase [Polynucleobacter asymbioticus]|jgi:integrase|uniref:Integrase n=1 Tax=Polynucleobacter asymbioticus TaxID=576611 RepID=A0AAC9NIA2_9BURK|nr:integrase arm-type DNA-binding domain-containing protein [Polynucleobacter asymbioticus]APB98820.1 integrase [Polynucleobacter asymbioticus]APC01123.1 integrase [Polynucleobacter asymbioticus]
MKLTATFIKSIKPQEKVKSYPDGQGLVLYSLPNGGLSWRYRYRFAGKANMLSLGSYTDVSLAEARDKREEFRKMIKDGVDPSQNKKEKSLNLRISVENNFEAIAREWHQNWKTNKTPKHAKITLNRLEAEIFPTLGSKPIKDISAPLLIAVVRKIQDRGASELAKRIYRNCVQVFSYGVAVGACKQNPVKDVMPSVFLQPTTVKNIVRIDAKELPELLAKIDGYGIDQRGNAITRLAMQFMALTFVRTAELIGAHWDEIDLKKQDWRIPAERMKMGSPHIVSLSNQAIEVLNQLKEITGGRGLVFPSEKPSKSISNNTILYALYRLGYHGRMTGHGFRGLASTILHEQGYQDEHIELQLAHTKRNKVSAAYDHAKYLPQRAKMMQDWADYLDSARGKNDKN